MAYRSLTGFHDGLAKIKACDSRRTAEAFPHSQDVAAAQGGLA